MRTGRSLAGGSTTRRLIAVVSLFALLFAGWASAAHAGSPDEQACGSVACHHGDTHHGSGAPGQPSRHDSESCALCRVLAQVPIPAALPAPLPTPKAVIAAPLPTATCVVPPSYVGFALARGPPSSSLA